MATPGVPGLGDQDQGSLALSSGPQKEEGWRPEKAGRHRGEAVDPSQESAAPYQDPRA